MWKIKCWILGLLFFVNMIMCIEYQFSGSTIEVYSHSGIWWFSNHCVWVFDTINSTNNDFLQWCSKHIPANGCIHIYVFVLCLSMVTDLKLSLRFIYFIFFFWCSFMSEVGYHRDNLQHPAAILPNSKYWHQSRILRFLPVWRLPLLR